MGQPIELVDGFVLTGEVATPDRPMSMRRAVALWVALSAGGWCLIAACLTVF